MGDVDIALRYMATRHPDDLARTWLGDAAQHGPLVWLDSQLASLERRVDKGLLVPRAHDRLVLHPEWCWTLDADFPYRVHEYQAQILAAMRAQDIAALKTAAKPLPVRVLTIAVVLNGSSEQSAAVGRFVVSPDDAEVRSVTEWRIDRIYAATAEALLARPGIFWSAFVPYAVDASERAVEQAVRAAKTRAATREEYADTVAALAVLADHAKKVQGLKEVVMALVEPDIIKSNWIYKQGQQEGQQHGRRAGLQEGREQALREVLLTTLRTRGLKLTPAQRARIMNAHDPDQLTAWVTAALTAKTTGGALAAAK